MISVLQSKKKQNNFVKNKIGFIYLFFHNTIEKELADSRRCVKKNQCCIL